jgi:hypothetical protein
MEIRCPPDTLGNFSKGSYNVHGHKVPSKYTWKFLKVLFSVFLKFLILGKETLNNEFHKHESVCFSLRAFGACIRFVLIRAESKRILS